MLYLKGDVGQQCRHLHADLAPVGTDALVATAVPTGPVPALAEHFAMKTPQQALFQRTTSNFSLVSCSLDHRDTKNVNIFIIGQGKACKVEAVKRYRIAVYEGSIATTYPILITVLIQLTSPTQNGFILHRSKSRWLCAIVPVCKSLLNRSRLTIGTIQAQSLI